MELKNKQKEKFTRALSSASRMGGIATIELLIAFAIIVLTLTGVIVVVFGNQAIALDSQLNNLALYKAEEELEGAYEESRIDFATIASASVSDGVFSIDTEVTPSQGDCFKIVKTTSSWGGPIRPQELDLLTWFANPAAVLINAGDCPTSPSGDDFDDPDAFHGADIGGAPSTALDVLGDYIYMTSNPAPVGKEDLHIYEIANVVANNNALPENDPGLNTGVGLNRIDVGQFGDQRHAFALAGDKGDGDIPEIQVIRVTDHTSPVLISSTPLPDVVQSCPTYCPPTTKPVRGAVRIHNGFLYVGLHRIASVMGVGGEEFFIFEIIDADTLSPSLIPRGKKDLEHNINDIVISNDGDYAFLATSDDSGEVIVLDISDKDAPDDTGMPKFNADGLEDGISLAMSGDTLYLGREKAGSDGDFYMIDSSDPSTALPRLNPINYDMDLNSANSEVRGILVRETVVDDVVKKIAFLAVDDPNETLYILTVTNPLDIQPVSLCTSGYNTQQHPTYIDMDSTGKYVFISNESNKNLQIIEDKDSCS